MKVTLRRPFYDTDGKYHPAGEIEYTGRVGDLPSSAVYDKTAREETVSDDTVSDDDEGSQGEMDL